MSSLDGLEGAAERKSGHYEPGSDSPESELARKIVQEYFELTDWASKCTAWHSLQNMFENIPVPEEGVDANELLFSAVQMLASEGTKYDHDNPHYLLDPLVQQLYDSGYRNLAVDLSVLPGGNASIGQHMMGRDEDKLSVRYLCDSRRVGFFSQNCEITLEGDALEIGACARGCDFYVERFPLLRLLTAQVLDPGDALPTDCNYYVAEGMEPTDLNAAWKSLRWRWNEFVENGNHIYVPDGDGWKEVLPDAD